MCPKHETECLPQCRECHICSAMMILSTDPVPEGLLVEQCYLDSVPMADKERLANWMDMMLAQDRLKM